MEGTIYKAITEILIAVRHHGAAVLNYLYVLKTHWGVHLLHKKMCQQVFCASVVCSCVWSSPIQQLLGSLRPSAMSFLQYFVSLLLFVLHFCNKS